MPRSKVGGSRLAAVRGLSGPVRRSAFEQGATKVPRERGADRFSGLGVPERCALRIAARTIQGYTRTIPLHNRHKAFAFNTHVPTRTGEAGEVWASAAASFACGRSDTGKFLRAMPSPGLD
jgi:hypothetical protein